MNFSELNIVPEILSVIEDLGYKEPTDIQLKAIPALLNTDNDFVGQAQTGTGKTAAFVIPLLQKIDFRANTIQAIILTPTRELAHQVEKELNVFGKNIEFRSLCVYGGTAYEGQMDALRVDKPQIIVGTPGRVIDLIKKKKLKLNNAKFCVLDEADEMLTMGFQEDVQTVLEQFKEQRQLMMFSATMPNPILKMIAKSFKNYEMVKIESKSLSVDAIEQKYFTVREKHFKEALARLIDNAEDLYGIVFCRTKIETREVGDDLKKRGHSVDVLNGDMAQAERDLAMNNFKKRRSTLLVCTDVAARGIDITNISHVFNYGLPRDNESYVHRIGRTGRAGKKGLAYTIVGTGQTHGIKLLEKHIKSKIMHAVLPSIEELKHNLVKKEIDAAQYIISAIKSKGTDFKTEDAYSLFESEFGDLPKEELMKLCFVWKFNKEMRRYNNLADIEKASVKKPKKPKQSRMDRIVSGRSSRGNKIRK